MPKATISTKGQVSIPKTIRERLNLKPGTQVVLDLQGEQIVMRRLVSGFPGWRSMRGMFLGAENLQGDLARERSAELAHDDARLKGL